MQLPGSQHFRLEQIADGVYAAIAREGGGALANAGIVNLGDQVLVFDTFMTPQAAADLRDAALELASRPVAYVVNSHWHADHTRGNQVFGDAVIVSTARTRELLASIGGDRLEEMKQMDTDAYLESLEEQLATADDEERRRAIEADLAAGRVVAASLPTLELRLPDQTFEERLVFDGSQRSVELITYGGGHTESDSFLYLPADRIAFMGDLLVVGDHAWIGHGDPERWIEILARVEGLGLEKLVPGHGPVGTPAHLAELRNYIGDLMRFAAEDGAEVPPRYAGFTNSDVFERNLAFLRERGA